MLNFIIRKLLGMIPMLLIITLLIYAGIELMPGDVIDFLIPMEIQGKKLTQKQVDTLIQKGQTGKISGFKDPKGNPFNGMIRLDENKNIIVDKI